MIAASLLTLSLCAPAAQATTAFVDCTVVPMDEERALPGHTVLVRDGVIVAVGPGAEVEVPEDARRIEGRGRYLMPGLADMHVHLQQHEPYLDLLLANGVTTVLDLSGTPEYLTWREDIRSGRLRGPTMYLSTFFDGPRPWRRPHQVVRSAGEARERVRAAVADGYDLIKVYSFLGADAFAAVIEEAGEQGIAVVGHVPHEVGPHETLLAGQVGVVHAEEFYNNYFHGHPERAGEIDGMVEMIAELGVVVTSNTSAIEAFVLETQDLASELARPGVRYLPGDAVAACGPWSNGYLNRDPQEEFDARVVEQLAWLQPFVKKLHDAGVLVLAGSDAFIPVLVPGFALHRELAELAEIGLSPFEALACATRDAGRFVAEHVTSEEPFGTVAVGMRADLLLLDANPLEDVAHAQRVAGVMARGTWHGADELRARLDGIRAAVADGNDFWRLLGSGDVPGALAVFERARAEAPDAVPFDEADLNAAGYYFLLRAGRTDLALELFELNVEVHPDSWNAHDSLGEALAAAGRLREALSSYERSVELDPSNRSGAARVRELREALDG